VIAKLFQSFDQARAYSKLRKVLYLQGLTNSYLVDRVFILGHGIGAHALIKRDSLTHDDHHLSPYYIYGNNLQKVANRPRIEA
jgi:hypothetical protein